MEGKRGECKETHVSAKEALKPSRPFRKGGNDQQSQVQQAEVRDQEVPMGLGQLLGDPDK